MDNQKYIIYGLILVGGLVLAWVVGGLSDSSTASRTTAGRQVQTLSTPATKPGQVRLGNLVVTVPNGWKIESPSSNMRIGQFSLPATEGDSEDAELAVFSGIGGSVDDNLQRWFNQFQQPDSIQSSDKAKVSILTVDGMPVTMADLSGTFVGSGMMISDPVDHPEYRLLAAIVEAPDGVYYFKLVGPEATLVRWAESFGAFVGSIKKVG